MVVLTGNALFHSLMHASIISLIHPTNVLSISFVPGSGYALMDKKNVISAFKVPNVYLGKTENKEQTKPKYILINVMVY